MHDFICSSQQPPIQPSPIQYHRAVGNQGCDHVHLTGPLHPAHSLQMGQGQLCRLGQDVLRYFEYLIQLDLVIC